MNTPTSRNSLIKDSRNRCAQADRDRARAEAESEMRETERLLTEVSFEMSAVIGVFSAEGERNSGFGIHEQRDLVEL